MKKSLSKKQIILTAIAIILAIVVVIVLCLKSKADQEEQRLAALDDIKWLVNDVFVYYKEGEEVLLKEKIANITKTKWMEEEFIKQGTAAIQKKTFDATYGAAMDCFWIKQQQLLLEECGYECPQFQQAYIEMLKREFHQQEEYFGFSEIANDALNGAIDEEEIYNKKLSYYSDPQSVFLNGYLPVYVESEWNAARDAKDTGAVIDLCNGLTVVSTHLDLETIIDINALLNYLTTDAEQFTVKEDEGYYANKENQADSDFEKDEVWAEYLPGDYIHSSSSSVKYYGDLASYFRSSGGVYKDENGNVHGDTATNNYSTMVYLKGERISFDSVNNFIKYAYEDGMISYHKDGYCYAISDNALVCFVGGKFLFAFANK